MRIRCTCGRVNSIDISDEIFEPQGRPQIIGAKNCPVCNRRIVPHVLIFITKESAGTHSGVHLID